MIGYKYAEMPAEQVKAGVDRRIAYTDNLMIVLVDFHDGPKEEPDPPHWHPHEQVTYVAEGEIIFYMDEQQIQLGPGDIFTVPPDKPHSIQLLTKHARLVDCFTPIRDDFLKE
jgi:quercetin dioxygenase-like cupin family protein